MISTKVNFLWVDNFRQVTCMCIFKGLVRVKFFLSQICLKFHLYVKLNKSLLWRILFFLQNIIKWEIWVKLTKKGDIAPIFANMHPYSRIWVRIIQNSRQCQMH